MIEQVRIVNDTEGKEAWDFINGIIEQYQLRKRFMEVEVKSRTIEFDDLSSRHPTDDRILQLIVDNRLVAFVFLRRDDWNHTELTKVFLEETLKECENFNNKILKNRLEL